MSYTPFCETKVVERNMQLGDTCLKNETFSTVCSRRGEKPSSPVHLVTFLSFSSSISRKETVPLSCSAVVGKRERGLVAICAADTVSQCNEACCTISAMRQAWEVSNGLVKLP